VVKLFRSNTLVHAQVLDSMAEGAEGVALASVLCNRALCYQKMDLHRKALRVSQYSIGSTCSTHALCHTLALTNLLTQ